MRIICFLVVFLLFILTGCGEKKDVTEEATNVTTETQTENPFSTMDTSSFKIDYDIHMMQNLIFIPNYFGEVYGVGNKYEEAIDAWTELNYSEAESKLLEVEKAIESTDVHYYADDDAIIKEALGLLYLDLADYSKAYDYLIDAYVTMNEVWGDKKTTGTPEQYYPAAISIALCHYYYAIGDYDSCTLELQKLKDLNNETETFNSKVKYLQLFVVDIMNDIEANIYKDRGKYIDAYNLYVQNIDICKEYINSSDDKELGYILIIKECTLLGDICSDLSNNEEFKNSANDFYELALKYAGKFDGEFKEKISAEIMTKQGYFLCSRGDDPDQGIKKIDEAIEMLENLRNSGKNSPDIIAAYISCAEVNGFIKDDNEMALSYYDKAENISQEIYGYNHPKTAKVYESMGRYYSNKLSETDTAIEYYNKSIDIYKNLLAEKSANVGMLYYHLAGCYKIKGDDSLSDEYLDKAKAVFDPLGITIATSE